jgi:hypothetical protein
LGIGHVLFLNATFADPTHSLGADPVPTQPSKLNIGHAVSKGVWPPKREDDVSGTPPHIRKGDWPPKKEERDGDTPLTAPLHHTPSHLAAPDANAASSSVAATASVFGVKLVSRASHSPLAASAPNNTTNTPNSTNNGTSTPTVPWAARKASMQVCHHTCY